MGDGLPEQICFQCAEKAVQLYLFKLNCEKADTTLRQQLGRSPFVEQNEYYLQNELDIGGSENIIVKPEINLENDDGSSSLESTAEEIYGYASDSILCNDASPGDNNLHCDACGKQFSSDREMSKHRKVHVPKPFVCETCGKSFTRDDLLLRHKIIHAIKLQEKNTEYESSFNVKDASIRNDTSDRKCDKNKYEKVQQMDTSEKTTDCLQCKICNKRFSKASHLTRHTKIHAAVKPYICQLCNKGFARAEQLMNHMNAHSGIKPHVCKICSKGNSK